GFVPPSGMALAAVSILGSQAPACKTLPDLETYLQSEGDEMLSLEWPELRVFTEKPSVAQRLDMAERRLDAMKRHTEKLTSGLDESMMKTDTTDAPRQFATESIGARFARELDALLLQRGWPKDSISHRQTAAKELLRDVWLREPATSPDYDNLAQELEPRDFQAAIAGPWDNRDLHLKPQRGETPTARAPQDGRALPGNQPGALVNLPTGRVTTLAEKIAQKRGLNMRSSRERALATALAFAEQGETLATASSYEAAHHAALRELGILPAQINLAEAATVRAAAEKVKR